MNNETQQKKSKTIISLDSQQSQDEQILKDREAFKEIIDMPQIQGQFSINDNENLKHAELKNPIKTELQLRSINLAKKQSLSDNVIIQIEEEEQQQSVCIEPKISSPFNLPRSLEPKLIPVNSGTEKPQIAANDLEKQKDNENKTTKRVHFGNTEIIRNSMSDNNNGILENNEQTSRNAKYFFQKEGNESQYEREQLTIQTETEKNQVINAVKFSSLQNKLEEIKGKRQKQGLLKQQEEKHKQLYTVDKSFLKNQSHLQASKVLKNIGGKRRNPFSCESDSGEHVEDAIDDECQEGQLNGLDIQDFIEDQQIVCKSMSHISSKFINELASFRQDLKRSENLTGQPNTKWGPCFLFQQNSFNLEKQAAVADQCTTTSQNCKKEEQIYPQEQKTFLYKIPEYVVGSILQFLTKNELFELRKVSKFFNNSVFFSIRRLEFIKSDSPNDRVIDILSKSKYLQSVKLGRLSLVTSTDLLDHWVKNIQTSLLTFECSDYTQLTENLFIEILKASPNITTLVLPFFGQITETSLFLLPTLTKQLTHLKIESTIETLKSNEKISDTTLAHVISDNNNLISFQVKTISLMFFEKLKEIESEKQHQYSQNEIFMSQNESSITSLGHTHQGAFARIQILKIHNIILTRNLDENLNSREEQLNHLKDFTSIKELKIVKILRKAKGEWYLPCNPQLTIINNIFSSVKDISSLCVGEWCTNEILGRISENLNSLLKIRIIGSAVSDTGLERIFQKMEKLEKVNIVDATGINGHCFESVISRNLSQIKVQFDDFRLNCLKCTIANDLQLPNIIILNLRK